MSLKIKGMAVFVEFLAGSGLAIFFHLVLNNKEAAYVIFAVGILLSLATYLLREEIDRTRRKLFDQYNQAHEIAFAIAQISDPECQVRAQELMTGAKKSLHLLQQGYIPFDESEFYLEGAKCSDQATSHIKAVDPVTSAWSSRAAHLNFYQANLRAMERGVKVTRVFVTDPEGMTDPEIQKVLLGQYRDGIDLRIAFRGDLPAAGDAGGHGTLSSFDFAIYDDRLVTDALVQPSKYFGQKTREPGEVLKFLHLFDLIEHMGQAVTVENDQVILAVNAASNVSQYHTV